MRSIAKTRSRLHPFWALAPVPLALVALVAFGAFAGLTSALELGAAVALGAAGVHYFRRFGHSARVLAGSQRDALTDSLTGLGNRRRLMDDLSDALSDARAASPRLLMLFDLDGFKRYNDAYGHPAGDALLARLGARLDASVTPDGAAYRLGGDEFCVLIGDDSRTAALADAAAHAVTETGDGFTLSASQGTVLLPLEAETPQRALQVADERLYVEKDSRRRSASETETRQVLAHALRGRVPEIGERLRGVPGLTRAVARALRLDGEELEVTVRAAELHDIGMLSVPDAILAKPDPLDTLEWEIVCQHTLVGERILSTAPALMPVARLVRSTHERWDGAGYPDGLSGDQIPRGARVIAACVAFEAIVSERPYRSARSRRAALAELQRCAGSQFDPAAVAVLREIVNGGGHPPVADTGDAPRRISDSGNLTGSRSSRQHLRAQGRDRRHWKGSPR